MLDSGLARRSVRWMLIWGLAHVTDAWKCPDGTKSVFERTSGVRVSVPQTDPPYPAQIAYNVQQETCHDRCLEDQDCQGFVVDHANSSCIYLGSSDEALVRTFSPHPGWSYHRKFCLPEGLVTCNRQWAFDRVAGMQLTGSEDKTLRSVLTRDACLEACAAETTFACRSARYEAKGQICVLSRYDKRRAPEAFRKVQSQGVDYLENQCIEEPTQCQFISTDGQNVVHGHTVLVPDATTRELCERACIFHGNFTCRSFVFDQALATCLLSPDDDQSVLDGTLQESPHSTYVKRGSCIDVSMHCESSSMSAVVKVATPFRGRVYAVGHPYECYAVTVTDTGEVVLTMPLHGRRCGSRNLGNGTFTNSIVVQHHPFVLRNTDRRINIACDYQEVHKKLKSGKQVLEGDLQTLTQVVTGLAPTPPVRLRVLDSSGNDVTGVELGEALTLQVEMLDETIFGIFGSGLVARSGEGSETVLLLDDKGCPVEPSVFPSLDRLAGAKTLVAPFQAFRFASDSTVKFQMTVSFCLDTCPPVGCRNNSQLQSSPGSFGRRRRSPEQFGLQSGDIITDVTMESALFVVKSLKPTVSTGDKAKHRMKEPEVPKSAVSSRGLCFSRPIFLTMASVAAALQLALFGACALLLCLGRKWRRKCHQDSRGPGSTSSRASISSKSELFDGHR